MKTLINLWLVLLFSICSLFTTKTLATAPSPIAAISIGDAATALIGSQACFSVDISNSGTDTAFGPYYRLILPPHLSLASANFLGQTLTTDILGVFAASPSNQISDTRANNASVTGTEGDSLTNLILPLGSMSKNGPTLSTDICVDVSTSAVLATPLNVSLQPVLQYGDTATGDNGAIEGTKVTAQITPTLMTFNNSNNAPAGKQVPGTTFGLTYAHVIDVAENQLIISTDLNEVFSTDLTFEQFNSAAPIGGTGCTYGAVPGASMNMSCSAIFGLVSATDVSTSYDAHINDILDGGTCANQTISHNSTLDGTFSSSALAQATSSNSVSVRHLTLIKSLSQSTLNPGDTITVSGTIRVSDFAIANSLSFVDQLPDGLTFGNHSDLTINGGSSMVITPVSVVNGDGSGSVAYDLTNVSGNIAGGSLINYSYTVTVNTSYNNAEPVLASDRFSIDGTATYSLTAGASNCTDAHSSSATITAVSFTTEIINPKSQYVPGEVVTFRLSMSVPSGDTKNIQFIDYFPLPVFDVSTINTTFNNDIVHSPTDTISSTPGSITIDAATNALIIDWPDISSASVQVLSVDVAMTISDKPFADNLALTTLFSGEANNTVAAVNSSIESVKMLVRNASVSITSGISTISPDGRLSDPGSSPANSDVSGVDAGDTMTQTITIINDGGSPAYKINISQPDLAALTGYTLTAATLNGDDISGRVTRILSTTLIIDNAISLPAGQEIVLTYTYQLVQSAKVAETLQPEASVTWSASVGSATAFTAVKDDLDITLADISIVASVTGVTPEGNANKFVVGDIVTYQAEVTIPEGTVTDLVVDFTLPPGLEYVGGSSSFPAGFVGTQLGATEVTTGVVATGQTRQFTFTGNTIATDNNIDGDNILVITLGALVKDDAANAATSNEQDKTLNVSATYQGASSNPNDSDVQAFTEHQLSITSTVTPSSGLQAGDSAEVTFVATNNGTAPAYDVDLSNTLDSNLFDLTSAATGSAGCNYSNPTFSCAFTSIAVGASQTVSYTATVQTDVHTGASFTINGAVTGDSQSGVVTGERDNGVNANGNVTTQALGVNSFSVIASSETFTSAAVNEPLAIGETVTYELVVTVPEGISLQTTSNDFISFTLPAGLQYISNSALIRATYDTSLNSATLAGLIPNSDAAIVPNVDNATSISGQVLNFDLGNVDNNDDDVNAEQIIVTITALVLNTDTNILGHNLVTTGAVNYLNQAATPQTDSTNHNSTVSLPDLAMSHTGTPGTVEGGDTITYNLTLTNTASTNSTNAYDWAIAGTVPAIIITPSITSALLSRGNLDISGCVDFTGNALSLDGNCLTGGQQGAEHYLAPGETITVVYQASVDPSIGFEQTIANTMNATFTSLPGSNGATGSDKGERIGDNSNNDSGQAVNDLVVSAIANVTSHAPSLSLTASLAQAAILNEITLNANFSVPVGTNNNFIFNLDLPTGLRYQNESIVINLPSSNFNNSLSPSTTPGTGTDPIVLDFGTITNSAGTAQTVTIAIKVVVDNILSNQNSSVLTANANLNYSGVVSAPNDSAAVTVIEPNLTLTQLITAGNIGSDVGDTISYQVTVNNSAANATAYRVNLSDLLPAELLGAPDGAGSGPIFTNISVTNPGNAIVLSGTATPLDSTHNAVTTTNNTNDTLSFTAFDLPPGLALTYSYDVVIANSGAAGTSVINNSRADYNGVAAGVGRSGGAGNDDDNDATLNNYFESASSSFVLSGSIAVQHNLTAGQSDANFAIGETVSMDVRVDLSQGTTNTINLTQVLDSGLTFISASVVAAGHISYNGAGTATESPAGTITVDLGSVTNNVDADSTNDFMTWRILARVNDDAGNVANTILNGNASTTSAVGNDGPKTLAVTVVEPNLAVTITPNSATTILGREVTFTVLVDHNNSGADAFDSELNLVIPNGLTYVASSFSGQGNLDDSNTSLLNVNLSSIALSDSKTFSFRAKVDNAATVSSILTVSLAAGSSYSTTSGTTTDDRDYTLAASGSTTVSSVPVVTVPTVPPVINVNHVPIAVNDSATVNKNTSANIAVLNNDSDEDNDILTVNSASATNGSVVINADGSLTYTPNNDFSGSDTINYSISDNNGGVASAVVSVIVGGDNTAPVAVDDSVTIAKNTAVVVDVLANDSDADNDSLIVSSASADNGTVVINANGSLTYIPNNDFSGSDIISYSISDDKGGVANAVVSVLIVAIANRAPVAVDDSMTATKNTAALVSVLNNDSDPDNDTLTVTSASANNGVVIINADGSLTYRPNNDASGADIISYSISDGKGGEASALVTVTLNILGNLPPIAVDDSYILTSFDTVSLDVLSNDSDPEGDAIELIAAQTSSGIINIVEGKLEFTPEFGISGIVTIAYSINDTHGNLSTAKVIITIESQDGPIITLPHDLCGEFVVNANALYTRVDLGQASAVDRFGNSLPVSLVDGESLFPPGLNNAFWQATDGDGNTTLAKQLVCVIPLVSIEKNQTLLEGESASVNIYLNGESPFYPIIIPYEVSGYDDDHDLLSGEVVIESGTEVNLPFTVLNDDETEEDEVVEIALSGTLNLGAKNVHLFTITEKNIAPEISLSVTQAQQTRLIASQRGGLVNVVSTIIDPNLDDTFKYQWQTSSELLHNESSNNSQFVFDPSELSEGLYQFNVTVTDSGTPALMDTATIYIEIRAELTLLTGKDSDGDLIPDNIEGYQDDDRDGIPDYLDRIDECNVLQEEALVHDGYLIEGQSGVCLRRGDLTIGGQTGGAQITVDDIIETEEDRLIKDPDAINVGGVFDYIAYGLPDSGTTFAIVMPQRKPIPKNAVYRKFTAEKGWGFFIEDERNSLWSTQGEPGYCPPPNNTIEGEEIWTLGLTEGHWCVQQIIEDGGVNDDDNEANGTIVDPGGVGVMLTTNHLPVAVDDHVDIMLNEIKTIDVLNNDTDEDNDALSLTSATTNVGNVTIVDNQIVYQSMENYSGDITISYGLTDNHGGTDHAVVYLGVMIDLAPQVNNEKSQINQGRSISINLLDNDSDEDKDTLTLISVDNSQVSFDASGEARFTPSENFHGVVTVQYTVQDRFGNIATGQWLISVIEVLQVNAKTSGGGSLHFAGLFLLLIVCMRRQHQRGKKQNEYR